MLYKFPSSNLPIYQTLAFRDHYISNVHNQTIVGNNVEESTWVGRGGRVKILFVCIFFPNDAYHLR